MQGVEQRRGMGVLLKATVMNVDGSVKDRGFLTMALCS
jgi:hypothetical protein